MADPPPEAGAAGLERSRNLVLLATLVSFVSQFFVSTANTAGGMLHREMDTDHYTGISLWGSASQTGWEAHKLAIPILAALAFIYWTNTWKSPFWMKWGHWLAVLMMVLCSGGAVFQTLGGALGAIAIVLTVWAALVHRKAVAAGVAPPTDTDAH
jgi:hypothetical protein